MESCLHANNDHKFSWLSAQHVHDIITTLQWPSQEALRRKVVEVIYKKSRYSEAVERRNDLWDQIEHEQSLIVTIDEKINKLQDRRSHDSSTIVTPHVITQ